MQSKRKEPDAERKAKLLAELRRTKIDRDKSYRAQALKLFPHVCGRCSREFSGKRLRELTVHHRDHDHTNNPSDGSNWELLCLYCHDHEHEKSINSKNITVTEDKKSTSSGFSQFEDLDSLLGK